MALVDDTEAERLSGVAAPRSQDPDSRARAFNAKVLSGRLRAATRQITDHEGGGVLMPVDLDEKSNRPVLEVLQAYVVISTSA